jgi:hypothetical protein
MSRGANDVGESAAFARVRPQELIPGRGYNCVRTGWQTERDSGKPKPIERAAGVSKVRTGGIASASDDALIVRTPIAPAMRVCAEPERWGKAFITEMRGAS